MLNICCSRALVQRLVQGHFGALLRGCHMFLMEFTFVPLIDSSCDKKAKKLRSHYLANPMAEYMHFTHHKERELDKTYKEYKAKHGKNYTSPTEHERRKHIFKHNLRCLHLLLLYCMGEPFDSLAPHQVISVFHITSLAIVLLILFYRHYRCIFTWREI